MKRLLLKAAKKEMHSELWAGDESGSRAYSTEEPCQTRRVVLRLPTFWPGSQPCSLLHSPGQSFSTRVFLLWNQCQALQLGCSPKHTPVTPAPAFPYLGACPCPTAWLGLDGQLGSPWPWDKVQAAPGSAALSWHPVGVWPWGCRRAAI